MKQFNEVRKLQKATAVVLVLFAVVFVVIESSRPVLTGGSVTDQGMDYFEDELLVSENQNVNIEDPFMGEENAPVTIMMFSDLKCGMCKYAWDNVIPEIERNYIESGKVKIVFKDFPLGFATKEVKIAEATHCAQEQGYYLEFLALVYENQKELEVDGLASLAEQAGLDTPQFTLCLESRKYTAKVRTDFEEGESLGMEGTPWFFVNEQEIRGAQPYPEFERVIEEELLKLEGL